MADVRPVWCVKAKDGWHAARPNRSWEDGMNNIATQCGSVIVLPYGCEKRYPMCKQCADVIHTKAS